MLKRCIGTALLAMACLPAAAVGQFKQEVAAEGVTFGETSVQHWQCGVVVRASSGPCKNIVAMIPVPSDWPEQQVRVSKEDITRHVRTSDKVLEGVKHMVFTIAVLPGGEEARAVITYEVTKRAIQPPKNTSAFVLPDPKKLDIQVRPYLAQSPLIESSNPKFKPLATQIMAEKKNAWEKVEALYDYVRDKVKADDRGGQTRGAVEALKVGYGNHEDLTSVFIALCRSVDIPARTVWVYQHSYPEFYLVDGEGKGFWLPCEVLGDRLFGGTKEQRPILQKGDSFRNPKNPRNRLRFMPEQLTGAGASPDHEFIRRMGEN